MIRGEGGGEVAASPDQSWHHRRGGARLIHYQLWDDDAAQDALRGHERTPSARYLKVLSPPRRCRQSRCHLHSKFIHSSGVTKCSQRNDYTCHLSFPCSFSLAVKAWFKLLILGELTVKCLAWPLREYYSANLGEWNATRINFFFLLIFTFLH